MGLREHIKKKLLGLTIPQEYICHGLEAMGDTFKVYLTIADSGQAIDITQRHLFLGYRPLIIGIWVEQQQPWKNELNSNKRICISLARSVFKINDKWKDFPTARASQANLILKLVHQKALNGNTLFIYQGVLGKHHLMSPFHQLTNHLFNRLRTKKSWQYRSSRKFV